MPRDLGDRTLHLDTRVRQKEALALYRRLGAEEIDACCERPDLLRAWRVFMEKRL